ncbi:hypothetical protein [Methanobacterium sp. ACI-7]|uniref:hypothetical protein n=1 Tax=unclassified Methanobacterium TaxID=2627676 RepID=UPI0039C0FC02
MTSQRPYIDKEFYMQKYKSEAVNEFWKIGEHIGKYVEEKGWKLYRENRQRYIAFYYEGKIVFGVYYNNKKRFSMFFKVTPDMLSNPKILDFEMYMGHTPETRYYIPSSGNIKLKLFDEPFKVAYENKTSKK